MNGHVIELRRMDTALTKVELISHLESDHSQALAKRLDPKNITKDNLVSLHRLIHLGLGR